MKSQVQMSEGQGNQNSYILLNTILILFIPYLVGSIYPGKVPVIPAFAFISSERLPCQVN